MKIISKKNKKRLIQAVFLLPFITCLVTVIGIRQFVIYHYAGIYCGDGEAKELFIIISAVLLVNVLASFASLIAYWCLENKVDNILRKERKKHHARKN